jgi:hypothetical protein
MVSGEFMFLVTGTLVAGVISTASAVARAGASGKHERRR